MITLPIAGRGGTCTIDPRTIVAIGLNYREHIAEQVMAPVRAPAAEIPTEPVLFAKTPNCLIGPGEAITFPKGLAAIPGQRTDYEGELALIIGRRAHRIGEAEALDHVYGYTCMNDVSQRNFQRGDKGGWFRGKSLDTFGPIGPCVVLAADIGDAQDLGIRTRLNGTVVQDSSTRHMIFGIRTLISFVSQWITLEPGDLITTGTPAGVGALAPGDVVEVEIERIGTLRNPVRAE